MPNSPTGISYTQWKKQNPSGTYQQWAGTDVTVSAPTLSGTTAIQNQDPTPSRSFVEPKLTDIADPNKATAAISQASQQGAFTLSEPTTSTPTPMYGTTKKGLQQWYDKDPEGYQQWEAAGGRLGDDLGIDSSTIDEKAAALVQEEYKKKMDLARSLGFTEEEIPLLEAEAKGMSYTDYQIYLKRKRDQKDTDYVKSQQAIAAELDKSAMGQAQESTRGAKAGIMASLSQGREGVQSTGNMLAAQSATGRMQNQLDDVARRLQSAQMARDRALEDMKRAQQSGDSDLLDVVSKNLASAENQIRQEELKASQLAADANKEAFDFIKTIGIETLAGMDINAMAAMFPTMDQGQLYGLAQVAKQKQDLKMSDPDYLLKLAQIDKINQELLTAGMTNEQKNYLAWKQIASYDPEGAQAFAQKSGFAPSEADLLDIEKKRADIRKTYDELGYSEPFDSKYPFQKTSTGIQWDVQVGVPLARGECGEFVNDAIFGQGGIFIDAFSDKMKLANSDNPVIGGAFIMNTGDNIGHVGLIESIDYNADGSIAGISILDSNAQRLKPDGTKVPPKTPDRSYLKAGTPAFKAIEGWFDPMKYKQMSPKDTKQSLEVDRQVEALMKSTTQTTAGLSTKDNFRGRVEQRLAEKQAEFREKGDIENVLRASAGGAKPDAEFLKSFSKGKVVVNQLDELVNALEQQKNFKKAVKMKDDEGNVLFDANPIKGWLASKNPWNKDAQEINAILQGAIPNLARGIYGEVGVLTERDIELYRKTLPNLQQTGNVQLAVAGLTLRILKNSLEQSLLTQADNGRNVSGNVRYLNDLNQKIVNMETKLGIKYEVMAPNGQIYQIPPNKIQEAISSGGKLIE